MNSLPTLTQSLLCFLAGLTVASALGVASYCLVSSGEAKPSGTGYSLAAFAALLGTWLVFVPDAPNLIIFGVLSVLWAVGTAAHRALQPSELGWIETFCKLAISTVLSAILCFVLLVTFLITSVWLPIPISNDPNAATWGLIGYVVGGACSPSVAPIFLWVWKSLKLRPGIDRHLKEGE